MSDMERACRAAAARYLTLADAEQDDVRRLGLLTLALGALSTAREHCIPTAGAVLVEPDRTPRQQELPT